MFCVHWTMKSWLNYHAVGMLFIYSGPDSVGDCVPWESQTGKECSQSGINHIHHCSYKSLNTHEVCSLPSVRMTRTLMDQCVITASSMWEFYWNDTLVQNATPLIFPMQGFMGLTFLQYCRHTLRDKKLQGYRCVKHCEELFNQGEAWCIWTSEPMSIPFSTTYITVHNLRSCQAILLFLICSNVVCVVWLLFFGDHWKLYFFFSFHEFIITLTFKWNWNHTYGNIE